LEPVVEIQPFHFVSPPQIWLIRAIFSFSFSFIWKYDFDTYQQTKANQENKWMKMKIFWKIIIIVIISDNNNKVFTSEPIHHGFHSKPKEENLMV